MAWSPRRPENISCEEAPYVAPASEFLPEVDGVTLGFIILAIFFTAIILVLYVIQFFTIRAYISSTVRQNMYQWMAGIFPVTAFCSIIGCCVPRSLAPMDVFILLWFAWIMFLFSSLILELFGGEENMNKAIKAQKIKIQQSPCCCCCQCLPLLEPTEKNLKFVYYISIQVAIVRPAILFILSVAMSDGAGHAPKALDSILNIINIASTMTSMWGLTITTSFSEEPLRHYAVKTLFSLLKMIIVTYNLQGAIFGLLANADVIKCDWLVTGQAKAKIWNHILLVAEVLIFSLVATWKLRPEVNSIFDKHPANSKKNEEDGHTSDSIPQPDYDNPANVQRV